MRKQSHSAVNTTLPIMQRKTSEEATLELRLGHSKICSLKIVSYSPTELETLNGLEKGDDPSLGISMNP